ncbi:hypothetical protein [Periweissella fabalis]|uniref:Lipoprotein n=1 Tax=Periweissella fabalis TaxID=1070421 RepID=A0A7X6S2I6_9LACO|nr:hypothetical protein [Periweissella fabalis]MCM0599836.1 hypothetical protein [Periweissella fabalis]NKZ24109.1 hypothetical protein [Periweissella fabalis]
MKKFILAIPIAFLGLSLTACGNNQPNQVSDTTSKISSNDTSNSNNEQHHNERSSSSSSNKSVTSTQTPSKPATTDNRIGQLNTKLVDVLGKIALPQVDGLNKGSANLNVRYTGDTNNYQIFYSVGNQPRPFNAANLKNENPYAIFQKQTFSSVDQAAQQINYISPDNNQGLPSTDLGSGITGYSQMGAGNIHLVWNEGNWSLSVHAINIENQDPKPMAKEIVTLLNTYRLPIPDKHGQVQLDVNINPGARDQIIRWQAKNVVYTITAHDPSTAIKLAASIK